MLNVAEPPHAALVDLVRRCQQEHLAYQREHVQVSPACLALFGLAFAGNQAAWELIYTVYESYLRKIIGQQRLIEVEDALQQTWLDFARSAPKQPNLLQKASIAPLLAYLRRTAKTAVLQLLRKQKEPQPLVSLEAVDEPDRQPAGETAAIADPADPMGQVELRLLIDQRLADLLHNAEERLLFRLRYELELKPQEIAARYGQQLGDYPQIATMLQRINRRLTKDETLNDLAGRRQKMAHAAFIQIGSESHEAVKDQRVDKRCTYDEEVLIDYLTGVAAPEVAAAIAVSPACQQAAQQVAQRIKPLLALFQRLHCPSAEELVAYQERQLPAVQRLLLYQHLADCPTCQEEVAFLAAADSAVLERPSLVRRLVEALFYSPLAMPQPMRGAWLHYRTPQVMVNISMRKSTGKPRTWTLHAQLRSHEGQMISDQAESATLQNLSTLEELTITPTPGESSLVFRDLLAGDYSLQIVLAVEEIVIRKLIIGDAA